MITTKPRLIRIGMLFTAKDDSGVLKAELDVREDKGDYSLTHETADILMGADRAVVYSKNTDSSKFDERGRAIYMMCGLNFYKDITETIRILKKSKGKVWTTSHYVVLTNVSL